MSDVLFIQREDLIRYTLIGGNVDTDKIIPHIKVAQDIHIHLSPLETKRLLAEAQHLLAA